MSKKCNKTCSVCGTTVSCDCKLDSNCKCVNCR